MKQHKNRPFVGVDGEGGDIDGRHEYLLLRAGGRVLETGQPLHYRDCLTFLATLPAGVEYVAFFFDYDATMILRTLPESRVRRILDREGRTKPDGTVLPVDVDEFQVDYLPHKELRVRYRGVKGDPQLWTVINDTGTFFQSSFLTALRRWGIGSTRDLADIESGKQARNTFGRVSPDVRAYNQLETELLEDLMQQFRSLCQQVGHVPRRWQGPGAIASTMFDTHGIPRTVDLTHIPDGVWSMAVAAYYGGRFETTVAGPVVGPVWQYDINSAYPDAIENLPCLMHGRWSRFSGLPSETVYVASVTFGHRRDTTLGTLPVRTKQGNIRFPVHGRGWYWSPEVRSAIGAGADIRISGGWQLRRECDCAPFRFVGDVYAQRHKVGKDTGQGLVLKLALNSLYGKLAQSIGRPPYANPMLAGLITSTTRAALVDAYRADPTACFMLATDGLFMGRPLGLDVGPGLGQWSEIVHDDGMFVVQPGLYFAGTHRPKTRGVPLDVVMTMRPEFERAWKRRGSVPVPARSFVGLRLAAARNKLDTAGSWVDVDKTISFDWSTKRRPLTTYHDEWGVRTLPYLGPFTTVGYGKAIGANQGRTLDRLAFDDNPEWCPGLTGLD